MDKYFFSSSIAPVCYQVMLLRFPVDTVVAEFEKWASGYDSRYAKDYLRREELQVPCEVHVKKVSAGRDQLPELILPQNLIMQFVFVPTTAGWTAVFGPCSFDKFSKLPWINEFAHHLARMVEIEQRVPYLIDIEHEPWVKPNGGTLMHRASFGSLHFAMYALPSDLSTMPAGCYFERWLWNRIGSNTDGSRKNCMDFLSGQTEPFKDYGFDFASLPEVTTFPEESFTEEHAEIMWSQFGEKQVEDILAPLGISPYDDAFYGTEGYLVRLTTSQVDDPYTARPIVERVVDAKDHEPVARIPLEKFQFFQGFHSGPLRSWSSVPITE